MFCDVSTRGAGPRSAIGVVAALLLAWTGAAAAPADPAAARVEAFDDALLAAMKAGAAAGAKGRDRTLRPAVESAFDLSTMTRYAVGPAWATMTDGQHSDLVRAFERYTSANYAHNFDAYSGQKFVIQAVQTRGPDKIVQVQLVSRDPTALMYRLHETPAGWKIIDVYYNGISQLTTRRADFAGPISSGGASGLLTHLNDLTAKLLD
jgi:phospholipid transport system substrate-binding protein